MFVCNFIILKIFVRMSNLNDLIDILEKDIFFVKWEI